LGSHRNRTSARPKTDFTSIYVNGKRWARLLELAAGSKATVAAACRKASAQLSAAQVRRAGSFTAAVLLDAERTLRTAQEQAQRAQLELAAANNGAWS
jgi:hypothetical protein